LIIFPLAACIDPGSLFAVSGEQASISPSLESSGGYGRTLELVTLRNASPDQIERILRTISGRWGIFPSLDYFSFRFTDGKGDLLLIRGNEEEAILAARTADSLDNLFPPPADPPGLFRISLSRLGAPAMRQKLLELCRLTKLPLRKEQFFIYPPGPAGSLFFRGTPAEVKRVRELRDELDQARYETFPDMLSGFWRIFRSDLSAHFLTVSTYAASVLILLLLHFILIHVPIIGRYYERCFTLVWTKVFDNVKGRGFILEVIRKAAATAVESVEQSGSTEEPVGSEDSSSSSAVKKKKAMRVASGILRFRGVNPSIPLVRDIISEEIEAQVYRMNNRQSLRGSGE